MININDKTKCCGCTACENKCPKNAIVMCEDEYGFKYPKIDEALCIKCGLCEKVCPYMNEHAPLSKIVKTIACGGWNKDEIIRKNSTSGGIFFYLAQKIIAKNGLVCGAIYDENLNVVHSIIDNTMDLQKILGSKYVQSDMKNNFSIIKDKLDMGIIVLFSGTPCQVEGLKSFLGKEYENLYTCDIICHGVPSPKVFTKYKNDLEKKYSSKLVSINFRNKISGWQGYSFSAKFENGREYIIKSSENSYMKAFLNDIDLRDSCPTCKFAKLPRNCDFTLGDFWGVDKYYPQLNKDNKGTSLVLVHSEKGKELLESQEIFLQECDLGKAIEGNPSVLKHEPANAKRTVFFEKLEQNTLDELVEQFFPNLNLFQKICKKILKK